MTTKPLTHSELEERVRAFQAEEPLTGFFKAVCFYNSIKERVPSSQDYLDQQKDLVEFIYGVHLQGKKIKIESVEREAEGWIHLLLAAFEIERDEWSIFHNHEL